MSKEVFCGNCESYKFDSSSNPEAPHVCKNTKAHTWEMDAIRKIHISDCTKINFGNNCSCYKEKKVGKA